MPSLRTLAAIRSGANVRGVPDEHDPDAPTALYLVRDVDRGETTEPDRLARVDETFPADAHVHSGDVLFVSIGRFEAATIGADPGPAIAVAPVMAIRPRADVLDAGYLAWYLAQAPAQAHFTAYAAGTHRPSITRKSLSLLPVPVPDLATQREIAEAARLARHERQLMERLAAAREAHVTAACLRRIETHE